MSVSTTHSALSDSEAISMIGRAYLRGLVFMGDDADRQGLRAQLAANLMALARSGETDEERLCSAAVARTLVRRPPAPFVYTGL